MWSIFFFSQYVLDSSELKLSALSEFLAGRGTVRMSRELLSESLILVSMQDTAEVECFSEFLAGRGTARFVSRVSSL